MARVMALDIGATSGRGILGYYDDANKLLKMEEMKNPLAGLNFQGTGKVGTPLGAQMHRTGAVADIKEAARANVATGKVFTPDESAHKAYAPYVDLYEEATAQMKDLYAKLNKL